MTHAQPPVDSQFLFVLESDFCTLVPSKSASTLSDAYYVATLLSL